MGKQKTFTQRRDELITYLMNGGMTREEARKELRAWASQIEYRTRAGMRVG